MLIDSAGVSDVDVGWSRDDGAVGMAQFQSGSDSQPSKWPSIMVSSISWVDVNWNFCARASARPVLMPQSHFLSVPPSRLNH